MGFQAVNGKSLLKFIDNSRIVPMIQFMADVRILNMKNEEIKEKISNTVYNTNLNEEKIRKTLKNKKINEEELKSKLYKRFETKNTTINQLVHGIELDIKKIKISSDDIKKETEKQIIENMKQANITHELKKEKQIIIILDNYRTHKSKIFQEACAILNIKIIFLPPYSPHLNPIEQIWKSIKRVLSITYIQSQKHLKGIFKNEFYKQVVKESFYKKWINKFIIKH